MTVTSPPESSPKQRAVVIANALESRTAALMEVMPDGLDAKRFMRATLTAIARNPDLLRCTTESLVIAVFEAAEIGVVPTGTLNRAWLVPQRVNIAPRGKPKRYETHAELRLGYQGLADLARQSGEVLALESRPVFEGDHYEVVFGTDPRIDHVPSWGDMSPERLTHVYAIAWLRDAARPIFEPMTRAQVDAVRARAPGANAGPWVTDYVQMARKTPMRRLCNYLPLTPSAQAAVLRDDDREWRRDTPPTGPTLAAEEARTRLAERLGSKATVAAPEQVEDEVEDEESLSEAEIEELGKLAFPEEPEQ